ncbi:MAG: hypothetical protein ACREH5_04865, partial [Candidatus Omnitrophota bacterium]
HYGAMLAKISLIRKTFFVEFAGMAKPRGGLPAIIMSEKKGAASAVVTAYQKNGRRIFLPEDAAKLLQLRKGDRVSLTPFKV